MTSIRWQKYDSAFALGYCSRCPFTDALDELMYSSDYEIESSLKLGLIGVNNGLNDYYANLDERDSSFVYSDPEIHHIIRLSSICDMIFQNETEEDLRSLYRLGSVVGDHIGMNLRKNRSPDTGNLNEIRESLNQLPDLFTVAVGDIQSILQRMRRGQTPAEISSELYKTTSYLDSALFNSITDKLRNIDSSEHTLPENSVAQPEVRAAIPEISVDQSEMRAELPDYLYYQGDRFVVQTKICRLLNFLLSRQDRQCLVEDLALPVWCDENESITDNQIGSLRRNTNKFFQTHAIPYEISTRAGYVRLKNTSEE